MNKRPKSREETPKEGSDNAKRYRTATICDRAAQSARGFESFSVHNLAHYGCGLEASVCKFFTFFQLVSG
jgi:hypothetical protein